MGERLQEAMSECFEKKSLIKFEHVDIGHELEKRGMLEMWPTEVSEQRLLHLHAFVLCLQVRPGPRRLQYADLRLHKKTGETRAIQCVRMRGSPGVRDLISAACSRSASHIILCKVAPASV